MQCRRDRMAWQRERMTALLTERLMEMQTACLKAVLMACWLA